MVQLAPAPLRGLPLEPEQSDEYDDLGSAAGRRRFRVLVAVLLVVLGLSVLVAVGLGAVWIPPARIGAIIRDIKATGAGVLRGEALHQRAQQQWAQSLSLPVVHPGQHPLVDQPQRSRVLQLRDGPPPPRRDRS